VRRHCGYPSYQAAKMVPTLFCPHGQFDMNYLTPIYDSRLRSHSGEHRARRTAREVVAGARYGMLTPLRRGDRGAVDTGRPRSADLQGSGFKEAPGAPVGSRSSPPSICVIGPTARRQRARKIEADFSRVAHTLRRTWWETRSRHRYCSAAPRLRGACLRRIGDLAPAAGRATSRRRNRKTRFGFSAQSRRRRQRHSAAIGTPRSGRLIRQR